MIGAETDDQHRTESDEDENYFVSMTDMMVGILFVFIIMLMIFALNFRSQTDESEQLTAEQKEQLSKANDLAEQIDEIKKQIAQEIEKLNEADRARDTLLTAIKDRLKEVGLDVRVDNSTGVLRLTEDAIYFPKGVSRLDEKASVNVDKVSKVLVEILPQYAMCEVGAECAGHSGFIVETVFIEGHTDTQGKDERNWKLSTERAVNTYRRIVVNGPELRALRNTQGHEILSVSGYAYTRPVLEQDNEDAFRRNRRIDLRFVMEADKRERLTEISVLLDKMADKVDALRSVRHNSDRQHDLLQGADQ